MIATETAQLVLLVLLGLGIIWIIVITVKKDYSSQTRAVIITVLVGICFIYVSQTKLEYLSFKGIKEDLFPPEPIYHRFTKTESTSGGITRTTYIFQDPGPPLILSMEKGGKDMVVRKLESLNRVLAHVGLPPVKEGVKELAAITGRAIDANIFRWDDYQLGILTIERGIGHDAAQIKSYPSIVAITVTSK
jgi:hypothetical protein